MFVGIMLKDNCPTCGESMWKETGDTEKDDLVVQHVLLFSLVKANKIGIMGY